MPGRLHRFTDIINETETDFYIQRNGFVSTWSGRMHIVVLRPFCGYFPFKLYVMDIY